MKTGTTLLTCLLISAITAFGVTQFTNQATTTAKKETSYERVIRTQTLRCGYDYWDGAVMKDDKGQIYGPWVDMMNAIGKAANLKIEWTERIGWEDVGAALKTRRIDAMCAGMWTSSTKAKEISFATPMAYQAIEAFVRADDHRFDGDINKLNDPSVKVVVIENDNSDFVAQEMFPKAQKISLSPLNGTDSEEMMEVMTGKADVCFTVSGLYQQFNKSNPGKVRELDHTQKLRVYGNTNAVDNDDVRLLLLLNAATDEIRNSGTLDRILDKANQDFPEMFIKGTRAY